MWQWLSNSMQATHLTQGSSYSSNTDVKLSTVYGHRAHVEHRTCAYWTYSDLEKKLVLFDASRRYKKGIDSEVNQLICKQRLKRIQICYRKISTHMAYNLNWSKRRICWGPEVEKPKASEVHAAGNRTVIQCLFLEPPVKCQTVGASSAAKKRLMGLLSPLTPSLLFQLVSQELWPDVIWLLKSWDANKPKASEGTRIPNET